MFGSVVPSLSFLAVDNHITILDGFIKKRSGLKVKQESGLKSREGERRSFYLL